MPFGFHLTMDTLPSGDLLLRPTTLLNAVSWIWRPSFERQRDFNPPEQRAAQRTLQAPPSPSRPTPTSRLYRLYGFPAPRISPRDEEGFASCLRRPCHRAVANAPPEHLAASVSCDDLFCLHPPIVGSASGSRILEV